MLEDTKLGSQMHHHVTRPPTLCAQPWVQAAHVSLNSSKDEAYKRQGGSPRRREEQWFWNP